VAGLTPDEQSLWSVRDELETRRQDLRRRRSETAAAAGRVLHAWRTGSGIQPGSLARLASVSDAVVRRIEKGDYGPAPESLINAVRDMGGPARELQESARTLQELGAKQARLTKLLSRKVLPDHIEAEHGDRPSMGIARVADVQVGSDNVQVNYFYNDPTLVGRDGTLVASPSATTGFPYRGHAFISYVREDSVEVDALQKRLEAAGIPAWRDTSSLWPGEDWRAKIHDAISRDALVFIACFSSRSVTRQTSYMNEELWLAIDQLRRRQPDDPWLIPVRFDDCNVPDFDLGAGRTLDSFHRVDLFGADHERAARRLVEAVQRLLP
jgi:predicted nucleic acid-binding Zn ribbon protein